MSTKVKFYTIGIETNEGILTNISVNELFNKLDELRIKKAIKPEIDIYGKVMKYYKFSRANIGGNSKYIIPFGTQKKNQPYKEDGEGDVTPLEVNLFDISFMYYDDNEKVALITCDQSCPKSQAIEVYLNTIFNMNDYRFVINPILKENDILKIKSSQQVKSVLITLNLHSSVQDVFNRKMQNNSKSLTYDLFNILRNTMNKYNSKKITIELGLGRDKDDSLDIDSLYNLLSVLDFDSSAIDKINVKYRDSHTEELDTAKLKDKSFEVQYNFSIKESSLGKDFLLNNAQTAIDKTRYAISTQIREYFDSSDGIIRDDEIDIETTYLKKQLSHV